LAADGKWMPEQILKLDPKELAGMGLKLAPEALWNDREGGLLGGMVYLNGCSAGFVSADGLLVTNFHCAFSLLQQSSTPDRDLMTLGFLADSRDHELAGTSLRATLLIRQTDVTAMIEGAVPAGAGDRERFLAVERKKAELAAGCPPGHLCEVASFDDGLRYLLIESLQYPDVRLVYSPALAVGDFGGEVDNWSWPRHSADLALLRVWAAPDGKPAPKAPGNVPLRPPHFFPVSTAGVKPGDFVMVPGFPGFTSRSMLADELDQNGRQFFSRRVALDDAWLDLMRSASNRDSAARLALADRLRRMENFAKNARGQVDGLKRGGLLERKRDEERDVLAWAASRPDQAEAVAAYNELKTMLSRRRATGDRDFLLEQMQYGPRPLNHALTLVRRASQQALPDVEREPGLRDARHADLEQQLRNDQKRLHLPTEEALFADLLCRFASLPPETRVPAMEALLTKGRDAAACRAASAALFSGTQVTDVEERIKMANESEAQLQARHDPLLDLAFGLNQLLTSERKRGDEWQGAMLRLRPKFRRAVLAHAHRPVAPDANGTLRLAFGHVLGYSPRDAVWMQPQTTLAGLLARDTGQMPFKVPPELRSAATAAHDSRFTDPGLHDIPVCFLADADTGGGNSGSPVLNGRGELVGVNFDRVWENITNDYGYNPDVARNVSVDIRYLLWFLSALGGDAARPLLHEMVSAP
jgi:Peptidase S46